MRHESTKVAPDERRPVSHPPGRDAEPPSDPSRTLSIIETTPRWLFVLLLLLFAILLLGVGLMQYA